MNIHPSKREVRFREEAKVRSLLIHAVLQHNRSFQGVNPSVIRQTEVFDHDAGKMVPEIDSRALEVFGTKEKLVSHPTKSVKPMVQDLDVSNERSLVSPPVNQNTEGLLQSNSVGARSDITASWRLIDRVFGDLVLFLHLKESLLFILGLHTKEFD